MRNGLTACARFTAGIAALLSLLLLDVPVVSAPTPSQDQDRVLRIRAVGELILKGDMGRAGTELEHILQEDPSEWRAMNFLGIVRVQQHRNEEAEQLFHAALRQNPQFVSAHVNLGRLYIETNHSDLAAEQFQQALAIEPGREDAIAALTHLWRSEAASALHGNEKEKSLSLLLQARQLNPHDADIAYEFGMVALRMSLYVDAERAFREVLEVRKDDPDALYAQARANMGLGKFAEATQMFQKYVLLKPADPSGHYGLGLALAATQKTDAARTEFELSTTLQPQQTEAYVQLGKLDLQQGNPEKAATLFTKVLQRDANHQDALTGMGRVEFTHKHFEAARDFLKHALQTDPPSREAHYYLGLVYARLGQAKESTDELAIASKLERQELDQQRVLFKLADTTEAGSGAPKPN
jgi:tetratricopeptide (TPR) repeat protein